MTAELIEKYLNQASRGTGPVHIHFRKRDTVVGLFIRSRDYDELRSKNLWRIVSSTNLAEWGRTKNEHLSRIFNGVDFTRLSEV